MDFAGKVAVVTGGASGMGAATARVLAGRGASVVVVDRNSEGAESVAAEIGGSSSTGDVSVSSFCRSVIESTVEHHAQIDVLVNAAGIIVRSGTIDTTDEDWRRIFSVNVDGTFYMCREAARHMVSRGGGAIVNFGSIWGDVGGEGHAAYAATKGAVHQLTRSLAIELARTGVRVNAVAPGEIRTPMLASERPAPPTDAELDELADRTVPMGRLGDPTEVAEVVAFLASDAASYMTGAIVAVDAGYGAR